MEKLLTIAEVAELLRLKPQTIYKMIRDGILTAIRVGAQWRVPEDKIQKWLDTQINNATSREN